MSNGSTQKTTYESWMQTNPPMCQLAFGAVRIFRQAAMRKCLISIVNWSCQAITAINAISDCLCGSMPSLTACVSVNKTCNFASRLCNEACMNTTSFACLIPVLRFLMNPPNKERVFACCHNAVSITFVTVMSHHSPQMHALQALHCTTEADTPSVCDGMPCCCLT